jgi:RsiW-degrading membrane proteinase PrsW (M82 family)
MRVVEDEPGWGQGDTWVRRDLPMFWLVVGLGVAGAAFLQALIGPIVGLDPGATSFMLIVWAVYIVPFVAVIVLVDLHEPEPPAFLAAAFAWGALVAVPVAYVANTSIDSILTKRIDDDVAASWYPALSGPWTEELLKAMGLLVVVKLARRQLTTVLDGIVYGAFVGLGFQVAENLLVTAHALRTFHTGSGESVVLHALLQRGLGLGLWSHAVWTGIVGAGVGYLVLRRRAADRMRTRDVLVVLGCLAVAMILHFLWNAPWWQPDTTTFDASGMGTYALKGLPGLALVAALVASARLREVRWLANVLASRGEVSAGEVEALRTWRGRRSARALASAAGGRGARLAVRRLQSAQVRLAVALATDRPPHEVDRAARRVRLAREVAARAVDL